MTEPASPGPNSRPGEANGRARLDTYRVCAIRAMSRVWGWDYGEIARQLHHPRSTVRDVATRHTWRHLPAGTWIVTREPEIVKLDAKEMLTNGGYTLQDAFDIVFALAEAPGENERQIAEPLQDNACSSCGCHSGA